MYETEDHKYLIHYFIKILLFVMKKFIIFIFILFINQTHVKVFAKQPNSIVRTDPLSLLSNQGQK